MKLFNYNFFTKLFLTAVILSPTVKVIHGMAEEEVIPKIDADFKKALYNAIINQDEFQLKNLTKIAKANNTDLNNIFLEAYERIFQLRSATPLLIAIIYDKLKSAKFLLKNGAKINDQIESQAIIPSKSMAKLLISYGYKIPSIENILAIRHVRTMGAPSPSFLDFIRETKVNPHDRGLEFIKFMVEQGSDFNSETVDKLKFALNLYKKHGQEKNLGGSKEIEEIIKYLEAKLKNRAQ